MKILTEQPVTDLAELHAKVVELEGVAQTRKEELRRKEDEQEAIAKKQEVALKKEEEKQRLKVFFADGKNFAGEIMCHGTNLKNAYSIKVSDLECNCHNIEEYIGFLRTAGNNKAEKIREDIKRVRKELDGVPGAGAILRERHTQERICTLVDRENSLKGELETIDERFWVAALAHMEGFIGRIMERSQHPNDLMGAVKVAMLASADAFHELGGRQKVLEYLQNTVVAEIEKKLSTDTDIDEEGIEEIERILNEVGEAVKQQVKK